MLSVVSWNLAPLNLHFLICNMGGLSTLPGAVGLGGQTGALGAWWPPPAPWFA